MIFDIMYLNGKSLMNEPFSSRRKILERTVLEPQGQSSSDSIIHIAPQLISNNPVKIRQFLKRQIDSGLEGIVTKRLDSPYSPGRTGFSWVKLKWEGKAKSGGLVDTIDCVVMGIYAGQGKRAGFGVGAFLVGIFDSPTTNNQQPITSFLTISKIGTGLTDEQWRELKVKSEKLKVKSCPKEYDVPKELIPDTWLRPELVVEIQADNITISPLHTAGFALRFPRLVRYRGDKSPQQTTTVEEVKMMYEMSLEH
jgi:DNA ligase-1